VRIDWPAVETLAASKADRTVLQLAQLMLAIRERHLEAGTMMAGGNDAVSFPGWLAGRKRHKTAR
jgi:hypothetical protein